MNRILLLDDARGTHRPVSQTLARTRPDLALVLVQSGTAALDALRKEPFDAVVMDLRAADTDAPALFTQLRREHPEIMRLALSGHGDEELMLRAVPVTHQFLSKPCKADELCEVIDRACALRGILADPAIRRLVGKIESLPAAPQTFEELSAAIDDDHSHAGDITAIVSRDTALAVKTLQIVNSAYFGLSQPISSIQAAVTYVGMEMIRSLALSACVFAAVEASPQAQKLLADLQGRSISKARLTRTLLHGSRHADQGFTAALLVDIGQAVLALTAPQQFAQALAESRRSGRPIHEVEAASFGLAHPEIGAYLLGLWGLPLELIEAVAYHHTPSKVSHAQTEVLAAVHVVDALVDAASGTLLQQLDGNFIDRTEVMRYLTAWQIDPASDVMNLRRQTA
jgi:HD-like signal output (HDOD) protein/ActR/RegA family two-component response regulator